MIYCAIITDHHYFLDGTIGSSRSSLSLKNSSLYSINKYFENTDESIDENDEKNEEAVQQTPTKDSTKVSQDMNSVYRQL